MVDVFYLYNMTGVKITEKHKIDVVQVYNIMREYRLDELNKSVIIANKGNI